MFEGRHCIRSPKQLVCVQDNPNIVHPDWCLCLFCNNLLCYLYFYWPSAPGHPRIYDSMTRPCSGKGCIVIESYGIQAIQYPQFRAATSKPEGSWVRTGHSDGDNIRRMQRRMRIVLLHVQPSSDAQLYKSMFVDIAIYKQQRLISGWRGARACHGVALETILSPLRVY